LVFGLLVILTVAKRSKTRFTIRISPRIEGLASTVKVQTFSTDCGVEQSLAAAAGASSALNSAAFSRRSSDEERMLFETRLKNSGHVFKSVLVSGAEEVL